MCFIIPKSICILLKLICMIFYFFILFYCWNLHKYFEPNNPLRWKWTAVFVMVLQNYWDWTLQPKTWCLSIRIFKFTWFEYWSFCLLHCFCLPRQVMGFCHQMIHKHLSLSLYTSATCNISVLLIACIPAWCKFYAAVYSYFVVTSDYFM